MGIGEAGAGSSTGPAGVRTAGEFAGSLTALRERAGLTVRKVAARAGQPPATVGGYFSGRHLPPATRPEVLTAILRACGVTKDADVAAWFDALHRIRRRRRRSEQPNPYPGLVSFGDTDAANFFGREELSAEVAQRVTDPEAPGLHVVIGPSGSGKSSLLRAGVVPALLRLPDPCRVTLFTPGPDPLASWAAARATTEGITGGTAEGTTEATTATSGPGLEVTIVDQFEEVFTLADPASRAAFLAELVGITQSDQAAPRPVVVALRADFFGEAASEPLLLPALETRQLIVGPLTDAQLEAAIVQPARRAGTEVEPALIRLLLRDVGSTVRSSGQGGHDVGVLPRLAHALKATWDSADGGPLTVEAYQLTGGVRGAVLQTAEETWSRLDEVEQAAVRSVFLRLTNFGTRPTGRPVPLADLDLGDRSGPMAVAIDAFVEARLLTIDAATVRVAHEALLAEWPRAAEWLASNERELSVRRALSAGAREWEASHDDTLLLRGSRLATAREINEATADLSGAEQRYLASSIKASESTLRRERVRSRRLRLLVAAVSVLAVMTASLAVFFARGSATLRTERDQALSRQIATESQRIAANDPALAAELAVAAYQTYPTVEARSSLLNATSRPSVSRLMGPEGLVRTSLSSDGTALAVAHADGTVWTWPRDPTSGRLGPSVVTRVAPPGSNLFALAFAPTGRTLVVGGGNDTVTVLEVRADATTTVRAELTVPGGVYSLAFDQAGTTLAAGRISGDLTLYRFASTGPPTPWVDLTTGTPVQTAQFGPGGLLAAGGNDAVLRLFERTPTGYRAAGSVRLGNATNTLFSLGFSHDGRDVAVGSRDKQVRIIDVSDAAHPKAVTTLSGFGSWVNTVAYSADGTLLAAGSSDSTVRLYRTAGHVLQATLPAPSPVTALTFFPDGARLAFGALDGVTRLWQVTGPTTPSASDAIAQVAYSRSGTELMQATLSGEGAVRLSDVSDWRQPRLITRIVTEPGANRSDGAAAMTADTRLIATGSASGHIQLWDTSTPGTAVSRAVLTEPKALVEWLAFSGDGQLLVSGDDANDVHLWDVSDPGHPRHLNTLTGATAVVLGVAISPDGRYVAAASADRTVRLWDISDPAHPTPAQTLGTFTNYAYSVAFSPDSRLLAGGSTDRTVALWRLTPGAPAARVGQLLSGPTSDVLSVAFNRDGSRLAAGTRNGHVWEWDISTRSAPEHLATLDPGVGLVYSVVYSPTQDLLAAGGGSMQAVQVLDDPARATQLVCENVIDPISKAEWEVHVPGGEYHNPCRTTPL